MFSFKLSPEQESLRSLAREFAQRELLPVAAEYDRSGEVPWPVIKKAWETGFLNMGVPEEYGGGGQGVLASCLVSEELAAACAGISATLALTDLACMPIVLVGTAEQKERWLRPVCQEMKMVSFCVTEPEAGSDVSSLSTTAKSDGDNFILNGNKQFITNASIADYFVVFAATNRKKGSRGLSAFDDLALGARILRAPVNEALPPLTGLADRHLRLGPCSTLYDCQKSRGAHLQRLVAEHAADGVLFLSMKFCEAEEFDYPVLKAELEAAGLPLLLLEVEQQMSAVGQVRTRLQAFLEVLVEGLRP